MLVIDTSVFIDYFFEKNPERNKKAKKFMNSLEGLVVFAPKIFLVELTAVAKRLIKNFSKEDFINLV